MFYERRKLPTRGYLLPLYLFPVCAYIYGAKHPATLFIVLLGLLLFLSTFWSYRMHILMSLQRSKTPVYILHNKKLCPIVDSTFYFEREKYVIEDSKVHKVLINTSRPFSFFKSFKPIIPAHLSKHFDKNEFNIEPPNFFTTFGEHMVAPFFVFQIFCGILWCLDEYVYHSLLTIVILVLFEMGVVYQRVLTMKEFRQMNLKPTDVKLIERHTSADAGLVKKEDSSAGSPRHKKELFKDAQQQSIIRSTDLIPGDVIEISAPGIQIPCDLLLLKGTCAVNEAMLTGESIPFTKEDLVDREGETLLNYKTDKKHILFGGTELLKTNTLTCYVLKTGFSTQQGELIRKMMCSENTVTANNLEAFFFILFLLFFAILASIYSYKNSVKLGKTPYKIMLEIVLILTNVVPPELPMELTIAVNASLQSLMRMGIFCLEPFRIPMAGKVDICCFDKTGTLTESILTVSRIVTSDDLGSAQGSAKSLSSTTPRPSTIDRAAQVMGTCHSLVKLESSVGGDSLEVSAFTFMNIELVDDNTARHNTHVFKVLKRYTFSSMLRRMTCVGEVDSRKFVAMKGAPEVVKHYLKKAPANYDNYEGFAKDGFRVLALAYRSLDAPYATREDLEKDMTFAGFVLYECRLKPDALETITCLRESNHKVVMITGDNLFTAQCVADKMGIVGKGVEGESIDALLKSDSIGASEGERADYIENYGVQADDSIPDKAHNLFYEIGVFARADPRHKEMIIAKYKKKGYTTLMCGDGTNDVGALKAAHIGVAIVEGGFKASTNKTDDVKIKMGDASVAAPFTVKTGNLNAVLQIVRQGRSTLVTTVQMYKILALNSLITAFSLSVLDSMGVRFSDLQMTVSGILLAFSFMFLTTSKPLAAISKKKPLHNIFNPYVILSILSQTLIHIASYYFIINMVKARGPVEYNEKFKPSLMNSVLFLISSYQQVSMFIINYIGKPFRESMTENKPLTMCLVGLCSFVGMLIFQTSNDFANTMEIVHFDSGIKIGMLKVICANFVGCLLAEKICFSVFML